MDDNNFDKFGLSNFKAFKELQSIDIAPITLIYGQNSGGKSTLLSSLMCVGQSLDEINKGFFKTNGLLYDAGTFDTIKNFDKGDSEYIIIELKSKIPNIGKKNSDLIYLESLESLLYPKFKLFITRNQKNRSKLIIEKIEIHYDNYLSDYKLVFNSSNIPIYRESSRGFFSRRIDEEFQSSKVFELEESSIKDLNEISIKSLKIITDEIKNSISNFDEEKLCKDGIFISRPIAGRYEKSYYITDNPFSANGLIKIAGILAGGWISNRFSKYKFTKFNNKNKELLNLVKNYVTEISKKNFELYESKNYIPSFFIDSSLEGARMSNSEIKHFNIKYLENVKKKVSEATKNEINKIKDSFTKKSISLISEKKSEKKFFQNEDIQEIELRNKDLNKNISNIKKSIKKISERVEISEKFDELDDVFNGLNFQKESLFEFNEKVKNYGKLNSQIYLNFNAPSAKKISNIPSYFDIVRDKLETLERLIYQSNELNEEGLTLFSKLDEMKVEEKTDAENTNNDIFENVIKFDLQNLLDSLEVDIEICEHYINLVLINTYEVFKCSELENKISDQESKLIIDNKPLFYELMCFLFEVQLDRKRTISYKAGVRRNYPDSFYKKSNLFTDPLFATTFIPYKLSQEIIHLRAFREAAKRAYSIDDINANNVNDVAFLITILEKEKNTFFIKRLEEDLKLLEIGETIYTKSSIDSKYDFKSIILKQANKKEVNIVDTGYGISQMLPIIIHSNTSQNNTLIIQQPETHIHPRLQAELASILARASIKPKDLNSRYFDDGRGSKNFIVETHSETILLRLLKEIRNGNFKQEDLKVFYVDKNENGSEIIEMEISDDGELISQWPEGFFSTELDEMMD